MCSWPPASPEPLSAARRAWPTTPVPLHHRVAPRSWPPAADEPPSAAPGRQCLRRCISSPPCAPDRPLHLSRASLHLLWRSLRRARAGWQPGRSRHSLAGHPSCHCARCAGRTSPHPERRASSHVRIPLAASRRRAPRLCPAGRLGCRTTFFAPLSASPALAVVPAGLGRAPCRPRTWTFLAMSCAIGNTAVGHHLGAARSRFSVASVPSRATPNT
ncbi:hypothetical protein ZWY2020_047391 [Hordeum vulgare]|nr:hypothetical protein ZWY2020_047391 [Hordeum vulgare]